MKGKTKKKKLIKGLVIAASFVLTIMLSVGATLAWFYDSDWASNSVTMAGAVGIQMRDSAGTATRGAGALHFKINGTRAYPGQAMDIQASVFNDGGTSVINKYNAANDPDITDQWQYGSDGVGTNKNFEDTAITTGDYAGGSPCYIRAQFAVLTNIGQGTVSETEQQFNASAIYKSLGKLINTASSDYEWVYHRVIDDGTNLTGVKVVTDASTGATTASERPLITTTKATKDAAQTSTNLTLTKANAGSYNLDSTAINFVNLGYYYLCVKGSDALFALNVGSTSAFLFNSTFVIPWALTNDSADKDIYIGVSFEAIQTYVPIMTINTNTNFSIWNLSKDNQLDNDSTTEGYQHYYYADSVQIMFNTSSFGKIKFDTDKSQAGAEFEVGGENEIPTGYALVTGPSTTISA